MRVKLHWRFQVSVFLPEADQDIAP